MKEKSPVCMECNCQGYSQRVRQRNRFLVVKETTFDCGARQMEINDSESNLGSIEFEGCGCAP